MKYFLKSDDNTKILTYEYTPNMEKLYEFKKKRLYDNPLMGSHYTFVPGPYRIKFRLESKNDVFSKIFASGQSRITLKEYDELVKNVCVLDFSRERITSEEEIERYMESFANGEIELSPNRRTYLYNCDEVYPTTLNVERNYVNITPHNFLAVLHVEPVFILGENLMLLKSLEDGDWSRILMCPSHITKEHLECFEFNEIPTDVINVDALNVICTNTDEVLNIAEKNQEVLDIGGVRVRK